MQLALPHLYFLKQRFPNLVERFLRRGVFDLHFTAAAMYPWQLIVCLAGRLLPAAAFAAGFANEPPSHVTRRMHSNLAMEEKGAGTPSLLWVLRGSGRL